MLLRSRAPPSTMTTVNDVRWNVVNSSGYSGLSSSICSTGSCGSDGGLRSRGGNGGDLAGVCRPTLDPSGEFGSAAECASSMRALYSAFPDPTRPRGWICSNAVLGECIETENVNVPFTYKVYKTYNECKTARECNMDSSKMTGPIQPHWFINADQSKCAPSFSPNAGFPTASSCISAMSQCGSNGQPSLQFTNPIQASDANWREPYQGFRTEQSGRNVTPFMQTPQIPLNPVDRPAIVGRHQVSPGLSSQGYSVY